MSPPSLRDLYDRAEEQVAPRLESLVRTQEFGGLGRRLEEIQAKHDAPVSLVGWSLGGIFARKLARSTPELVRQVVTLGSRSGSSPTTTATPVSSSTSKRYHVEEWDMPLENGLGPPPVPATSSYSRLDGIVAWRACLDDPGPQSENIEVTSAHWGFGHHPAVLWALADRLAQPEGQWRPFAPPAMLRPAFPGSAPDSPRA